MTEIEEIRQRLQRKENKWNKAVGIKRFYITPPITKFTLSDPERVIPDKDWIKNIATNSYWGITSNNTPKTIESDEWDAYMMFYQAIPKFIPYEKRSLRYQGYLFGDATILFTQFYGGDFKNDVLGYYKAPEGEIVTDVYIDVPEGTRYIYIPKYKNPPADVKINFEITYQDFTEFDVTPYIASWTDLEDILERDMTTGVFSSVSFPIYLTGMGMDFMTEVFALYALHSKVAFNVYLRDDIELNVYRLIKSAPMDFQTYKENNTQVEISLVDSSLNEQLNSQGKTKYDIPVNELADTKKWNYNRIMMFNRGNYSIIPNKPIPFLFTKKYIMPYIYLNSAEMTPGSDEHEFRTQSELRELNTDDNYFFKAAQYIDDSTIYTFDLSMKFSVSRIKVGDADDGSRVMLLKNGDMENPMEIFSFVIKEQENDIVSYVTEIDIQNKIINLIPNDKLSIVVERPDGMVLGSDVIVISKFDVFEITYTSTGPIIENINIIKPETLCQNLLDKVSGSPGKFTCQFNWADVPYKHMLCAAESIRDFRNANLHGSLNDLLEWMKVLGYEYSADGNVLVFKQRDEFFKPDVTAVALKNSENADLRIEGSDKFAYTSLQIGYESQDYESVNGRFEVNGMFEYSTGYKNITSNVLKLISPYRADPIGIELLCWERKNSSKDTKSDNDIFFIAMKEEEDYYSVYHDIVAIPTDAPNMKMFNAVFNPYFLVKQNESLIGINSTYLKFTSTDSNRSSTIGDIDIYADQPIEKQLFKPYTYNFVTGNHIPLPDIDVRNGLVKFWYNNTLKIGFIQKILKNYSKETESTWILYAK